MQLGGRGQWRIERAELEAYIQRCYEETEREMRGSATTADPLQVVPVTRRGHRFQLRGYQRSLDALLTFTAPRVMSPQIAGTSGGSIPAATATPLLQGSWRTVAGELPFGAER